MNRKELSAIKGRIKNIFRRNRKEGGLVFILSVICLCFVLFHYSDDKLSDTNTVSGAVTDVKYHYMRAPWLTFKVGDVECFYMIADAGNEKTESVIEEYERLERSGKIISALTIEDWDFNFIDGARVVGVVGEKGSCFSLDSHNRRQKIGRMALSAPPVFMIAFSSYFLLLDIKNEIIIPARKRKKRIARKQERKAKFAARQALEQEQSPPQTKQKSKKNKSKKSR